MDEKQAVRVFSALAQAGRLRVLRLLVKAGPGGLPASTICETVGGTPSTMSFHFRQLEHAGLIISRRESRWIFYSANYDALDHLHQFLMEECCQGHPDLCAPVLKQRERQMQTPHPEPVRAVKNAGSTRQTLITGQRSRQSNQD